MDTAPKVGTRVQVKPGHRYYPLTGTVEKLYPKRVCLNEDELDDPDVAPRFGGFKPESQWSAVVLVDYIPPHWPYHERDGEPQYKFAPQVGELEEIKP